MIKPINVSKKLSDGREISIETGKLAKQAQGSVELRMGDTHMLATVVSNFEAREGVVVKAIADTIAARPVPTLKSVLDLIIYFPP